MIPSRPALRVVACDVRGLGGPDLSALAALIQPLGADEEWHGKADADQAPWCAGRRGAQHVPAEKKVSERGGDGKCRPKSRPRRVPQEREGARRVEAAHHGADRGAGDHRHFDARFVERAQHADMTPTPGTAASQSQ